MMIQRKLNPVWQINCFMVYCKRYIEKGDAADRLAKLKLPSLLTCRSILLCNIDDLTRMILYILG